MIELLKKFSVDQIIIFVVLLAMAIKGAFTWMEWMTEKLRKKFGKEDAMKKHEEWIQNELEQIRKTQLEMSNAINKLNENVDLLMTSDKDDIKAWITEKHHYFCYKIGHIDDYNLDCIEKRYSHYRHEGGNSFVDDLMKEIRALPKTQDLNLYQPQNKQ